MLGYLSCSGFSKIEASITLKVSKESFVVGNSTSFSEIFSVLFLCGTSVKWFFNASIFKLKYCAFLGLVFRSLSSFLEVFSLAVLIQNDPFFCANEFNEKIEPYYLELKWWDMNWFIFDKLWTQYLDRKKTAVVTNLTCKYELL